MADPEEPPTNLEEAATGLEERVEGFTLQLTQTNDGEDGMPRKSARCLEDAAETNSEGYLFLQFAKLEQQKAFFGNRKSYYKTYLNRHVYAHEERSQINDQLKPAYNVQAATENQFVLFYSIHQRSTDTRCFIPHMERLAVSSLPKPKNVISDLGYGNAENYLYGGGLKKTSAICVSYTYNN
ncbi:hypothetical protein ACFPXP_08345 [Marinicrinis lubricantis]|uniref:Uncharacterized protein n=1 Tax=Marinicrinis lubricantis TaxID=2086470 RepID=A0ABW1IN29_9BACL